MNTYNNLEYTLNYFLFAFLMDIPQFNEVLIFQNVTYNKLLYIIQKIKYTNKNNSVL